MYNYSIIIPTFFLLPFQFLIPFSFSRFILLLFSLLNIFIRILFFYLNSFFFTNFKNFLTLNIQYKSKHKFAYVGTLENNFLENEDVIKRIVE